MIKKLQSNFIRLVRILSDGCYHDGNSLGKTLNMTRSAVWKAIKKLEKYQIEIKSNKGKGYALASPLQLLDPDVIKQHCQSPSIILDVFESIDSTNDYLKAINTIEKAIFCIAEEQTKGKGRLNRPWVSPFGKNIYFSCRYPFNKDVSALAGLSLVVGLAVVKTLQSYGISDKLQVKWPNDVYYDYKKLSGILLEIQAESHDCMSHAIIGVGINVNLLDDKAITQSWTSMHKILGHTVDRNLLCARLINYLLPYLKWFDEQGLAPFLAEWMESDCLLHKEITLKSVRNEITGIVRGVNAVGHLLVELADGRVCAFSSGEVTIVKDNLSY